MGRSSRGRPRPPAGTVGHCSGGGIAARNCAIVFIVYHNCSVYHHCAAGAPPSPAVGAPPAVSALPGQPPSAQGRAGPGPICGARAKGGGGGGRTCLDGPAPSSAPTGGRNAGRCRPVASRLPQRLIVGVYAREGEGRGGLPDSPRMILI